ncbi:hypothetical protein CALCODRAFT_503898 [Calocera cornea HHB12733]|uniref:Uncharacterized protein n=1 Tax=Calocera cornea HHB12733 TaxID=1353952 RepID=A0A165CPJ7_9BASI|nr:hypothetical protein CALCODRAFT_503898 [Calocera cornea HHB12733]
MRGEKRRKKVGTAASKKEGVFSYGVRYAALVIDKEKMKHCQPRLSPRTPRLTARASTNSDNIGSVGILVESQSAALRECRTAALSHTFAISHCCTTGTSCTMHQIMKMDAVSCCRIIVPASTPPSHAENPCELGRR